MAKTRDIPDILGQLRQPVNVLDDVLSGKPLGTFPKEVDYPVDRIIIGKRLRPVKDVTELAESMKAQGQLQAVVLLPDGTLVAGGHRVAAAQMLEWKTIRARIAELDEVDAELAEIDENLYRRELTVLEQAEHLQRRMELLEIKGQRAKAGDNQHSDATTTAAVADSIGISERSAQQRLQIARGLTQEARDALRDTELAESTTKLLEIAKKPQQYQAEIVKKVLETNWSVDIAANAVMPHIASIERYFDDKRYYARIEGTGHGVHATPVCDDPDAVLAAFERGEYSYELHLSHLMRSYLTHYGGSDSIFDHKLREAEAEDLLAAWQWRTTHGDKARTACNKMASKLRRLGYEAADIEGWTAPAAPAATDAEPDRFYMSVAQIEVEVRACVRTYPWKPYELRDLPHYIQTDCRNHGLLRREVERQIANYRNADVWQAMMNVSGELKRGEWSLTSSSTEQAANVVPSEATGSRQQGAELAKCSVCHRPLTDPASAIAGVGPCCAAKRATAAGSGSAEDDDENWRIDDIMERLKSALGCLGDYEEITGIHSHSEPLRSAIAPMLRVLESNRI